MSDMTGESDREASDREAIAALNARVSVLEDEVLRLSDIIERPAPAPMLRDLSALVAEVERLSALVR
jgi:hypothetical protein